MSPDTAANLLATVRDLAIIASATLLGWHHHDDVTLVFGLLGTLIGASASSRGTRLGVQAALAPAPGGSVPPPPAVPPPPRAPMGSTV